MENTHIASTEINDDYSGMVRFSYLSRDRAIHYKYYDAKITKTYAFGFLASIIELENEIPCGWAKFEQTCLNADTLRDWIISNKPALDVYIDALTYNVQLNEDAMIRQLLILRELRSYVIDEDLKLPVDADIRTISLEMHK